MKHFKKLKKFFKKKPKINFQVLFFESVILILVILVAFLMSQIYNLYNNHQGDFDALPQKYTILAYAWNPRLDMGFAKNIENNLDFPTLVKVANLEQLAFPKSLFRDLNQFNFTHKTIAYIWDQDQIAPVYLFKFDKFYKSKATDFVIKNPKVGEFYVSLRKNSFVISKNKAAIDLILGTSQKITTDNLYMDAIVNIPKNSFGQFYIQHKLLNQYLKNTQTVFGPLTYTPYVLDSFGVTVGSVVPNKDSIFISTYTNPSTSTSEFPFSTKKFNANFLSTLSIPEGYKFVVTSQSLPERVYGFLHNSGFQDSNKTISQVFKNILVSYNLTDDTLNLLNKILDTEFVLAIYPNNDFYFIFQNLNSKFAKKLVSELTQLMQYFDPKVISYQLPDGFQGRKLVPNDSLKPKNTITSQIVFPLKELNQTLTLSSLEKHSTLTNMTNLNSSNFVEIPKQNYEELLTISDEIMIFSKDFLYEHLKNYFDYADVPSATTATNFFHDGIQTVTILKWTKD